MAKKKFPRMQVLIMDDDRKIRMVLRKFLEKLEIMCDEAENGEKALQLYKEHSLLNKNYDVVILDWEIKKGMGGRETIQHLKKFNSNVKTILCSGHSMELSSAELLKLGFSGILPKPFKFNELAEIIEKVT